MRDCNFKTSTPRPKKLPRASGYEFYNWIYTHVLISLKILKFIWKKRFLYHVMFSTCNPFGRSVKSSFVEIHNYYDRR